MRKNIFIYLTSAFINQIIPFIGLTLLARKLTIAEFGTMALVQSLGLFTSQLCHFGMILPLERHFFEEKDDRTQYWNLFSTILLFTSLNMLLTGLLINICRVEINQFMSLEIENSFVYVVAHISESLSLTLIYFTGFFRNNHQPKMVLALNSLNSLLTYSIAFGLVYALDCGFAGFLAAQLISRTLVVAVSMGVLKNYLNFSFDTKLLKQSFSLSVPALPRTVLTVLNANFDKFILNKFVSTSDVGILSMAQKIGEMANNVNGAIDNAYQPKAYSLMFESESDRFARLGRFLTPFLYFAILIVLTICLFSSEIISLFAGTKYLASSELVLLLFPTYALIFFGKQNQISFSKKTYLISVFFLIKLSLNVPISYIMIRNFGTHGAVLSISLLSILMFCLMQPVHQRLVPIIWETKKISAVIGAGFFCAGLFLFTNRSWDLTVAESILLKCFLLFGFLVLGYVLKIHHSLSKSSGVSA